MKKYRAKHDDGSFVMNPATDKILESNSYNEVASYIAYYFFEQYIELYEKINNDYVIVHDNRREKFHKTLEAEWFIENNK
jgi:hypothetical protein